MSTDRQRLSLTVIWFLGLLASIGVVLSYSFVTNDAAIPLLLWSDVALVLKSVLAIYAAYLGGIIVFWFAKPFRAHRPGPRDSIRFGIALVGTFIVNGAYIAGLSIGYWDRAARLGDIIDARNLVFWLSFVVAPANLYFFGVGSPRTP